MKEENLGTEAKEEATQKVCDSVSTYFFHLSSTLARYVLTWVRLFPKKTITEGYNRCYLKIFLKWGKKITHKKN